MKVSIVLATYNGAKYIEELLVSLLTQTNQDWELIVSDDGSTDETLSIVQKYEIKLGNRLVVVNNDSGFHGPTANFINGLKHASGSLFMLCDQDDIWLPEKIELSVQVIENALETVKDNRPVLATCALTVTDAELNPILNIRDCCSTYSDLDYAAGLLSNAYSSNGSSMIFNQNAAAFLLNEANEILNSNLMYDRWLCLYTAFTGCFINIDTPLMLYRLHGANTVGMSIDQRFSISELPLKLKEKAKFYCSIRLALSAIVGKYSVSNSTLARLSNLFASDSFGFLLKVRLLKERLIFPRGFTAKDLVLLLLM